VTGPPVCRLATWNVEWATPGTRRGDRVAAVLLDLADVMVVTECTLGVLPPGHVVAGGSDWGYRVDDPTRRKVALWSRWPWTDVDPVGHPDLPPGRFVAATTSTPIGDLRVVGVCIPWAGAHVSTGRRDRRQWQDHEQYLRVLPDVLAGPTSAARCRRRLQPATPPQQATRAGPPAARRRAHRTDRRHVRPDPHWSTHRPHRDQPRAPGD